MCASASPVSASSPASSTSAVPEAVVSEIAALFDQAVADNRTAGITWAIVGGHDHADAVLASGAAGERELKDGEPVEGSGPMGIGTVSRIASMTKSFTAASILKLRDEGHLLLDDPIARYVPEAGELVPATPDSPAITLRMLLTMSAGFITDNPWGDRQEAMTVEEFAKVLRGGLGFVHKPGTGFEYSNTGYALLGRVVDEVSGMPYAQYIAENFLRPLGMGSSVFSADEADASRLAVGHRIGDRDDRTRFEPVEFDKPGVYGAMAGLFSSTADVARWVRFLSAADAEDSAERDQSPLSTGSRREMQQLYRLQLTPPLPADADGRSPGFDRQRGYGFGLVVERFPDLGEVISHSGGYPGFGSFMVWHRESGVGVVALANAKYGPAVPLSMQALRLLKEKTDLLTERGVAASPRLIEAAEAALEWVQSGGEAVADAWFADNMDLDTTREERLRRRDAALAEAGLALEDLAALTADDARVASPAHLTWTVAGKAGDGRAGDGGAGTEGAPATVSKATGGSNSGSGSDSGPKSLRIDVLIDPRHDALIQALDVTASAPEGRNY